MKRIIQYLRYSRMRRELYQVNPDTLRDVGIMPWDIDNVCKRAVYGD